MNLGMSEPGWRRVMLGATVAVAAEGVLVEEAMREDMMADCGVIECLLDND